MHGDLGAKILSPFFFTLTPLNDLLNNVLILFYLRYKHDDLRQFLKIMSYECSVFCKHIRLCIPLRNSTEQIGNKHFITPLRPVFFREGNKKFALLTVLLHKSTCRLFPVERDKINSLSAKISVDHIDIIIKCELFSMPVLINKIAVKNDRCFRCADRIGNTLYK